MYVTLMEPLATCPPDQSCGQFRMSPDEIQGLIDGIQEKSGWESPPPHPSPGPLRDPLRVFYHYLHAIKFGPEGW